MQTATVDRRYWNIVKGLGILLVVVGHINTPATDFIYLFHMPFFFFISGYLYNEQKYGDDPYANIISKLKSSWIKYVGIFWVFILLHNLFVKLQIAEPAAEIYSKKELLVKMSEAMFGNASEFLAGPLWFVPVSVIASCMLGFIITFSRRIEQKMNDKKMKYLFQCIVVVACGVFGYILMKKRCVLYANMHISILVVPFLWGGYLLRTFVKDLNKFLHPVIAVVCALIVFLANFRYKLELILFMDVYPAMHLVAFCGIYMCLYIAKVLQAIPRINTMFNWSGKASFAIMASHYAIFRLFDWTLSQFLYPEDPITNYLILPNSFPDLKLVYVFIGYVIPLCVYVLFAKKKEGKG